MDIVGVLGGMGPQATIDFYQRIVNNTPASKDQEHLRVLIWSDPKIPDRTAAIFNRGDDPTPHLIKGVEILCRAGAAYIAVPCNTAHYYLPAVQKKVPAVPIFDMIAMAAKTVTQSLPLGAVVGLTATDGTIASGLYQSALIALGYTAICPSHSEQEVLMDIVYGSKGVKAGFVGRANKKRLEAVVTALIARGAQAIILGCTELSVVGKSLGHSIGIVDPMDVLALAVTRRATGYYDPLVSFVSI